MPAAESQQFPPPDSSSTAIYKPPNHLKHSTSRFSKFADFVTNIVDGLRSRYYTSDDQRQISNIDIDQFNSSLEDWDIQLQRDPATTNHASKTLKSPRTVLVAVIPNKASQLLRMDLLLLDESPPKNKIQSSAWNGCSSLNRAQVWRMLLGYEPLNYHDRAPVLHAKRTMYQEYLRALYAPDGAISSDSFGAVRITSCLDDETRQKSFGSLPSYSTFSAKTLRQIEMDLPRTHPEVPIFHVDEVRNPMRRILYLFGMLNPNKNYVQGMNEILTPLLAVFLSDYLKDDSEKGIESFLVRTDIQGLLTEQELANAEADAFWTFTRMLSCVEDNFVTDQPGILRRVKRLEDIVYLVDPLLSRHLARNGNEFIQFSFRWMNCLLMREVPFKLVVKIWDVLLAERDGLSDLHVYVCAAMLTMFSSQLMTMHFEDCIMFLQHLPTKTWTSEDVDELLSQAFLWKRFLALEPL